MRSGTKTLVVLFTFLFLTFSVYSPLLAESQEMEVYTNRPEEVSGAAMVFDFLIIRPLSLPACICGIPVFLVTIPLTGPSGQVEIAFKKLVEDPFRFTFQRPLGDI